MGLLLRLSRDKRSPVAGIYFILASLGKLVFGLGASLAVKGHFASDLTTLVAGCVCIGIGFVCVVLVALGFSAALHQINRAFAIFLKCVSIGGGIIIAVGYASNRLSLFAGLGAHVSHFLDPFELIATLYLLPLYFRVLCFHQTPLT